MSQVHIDPDDIACALNRLIAQGMDMVLAESIAQALERQLAPYLGGLNDRLDKIIERLPPLPAPDVPGSGSEAEYMDSVRNL